MPAKKTAEKKPAAPKHPDFVFPEVLGNDYHPYQLKLRIFAKQLEDTIYIKGVKGSPGDWVFKASDGGVGILTTEELLEHYENAPPGTPEF